MAENDHEEPLVRNAEEHPLFLLATLNGTQRSAEYDAVSLLERNRADWHTWLSWTLGYKHVRRLQRDGVNGLPERVEPADVSKLEMKYQERLQHTNASLPKIRKMDFSHLYFRSPVNFDGYVFPSPTFFDNCVFFSVSSFQNSKFLGGALFDDAVFAEKVSFDRADFEGLMVRFLRTEFKNAVSFYEINCRTQLFADKAIFDNNVNLNGASIERPFSMLQARVGGSFDAKKAEFVSDVSFAGSSFFSFVSFVNASFRSQTLFSNAKFQHSVPDFRGATLHEATEFDGVEWPQPPNNSKNVWSQIYAYERLKLEMERLKKHEDEQAFFRRELRLRRALESTEPLERVLNWLYEAVSGYGQSFVRPLVGLAAVFFIGGAAIKDLGFSPGQALLISLANILPFLPVKRDISSSLAARDIFIPDIFHLISLTQSVFGLLLVFLLLLALRNRFKLR